MTASPVAQSKLTPEVIEAVETSLRVNPSWSAAADYAGITDRTLRIYRERADRYQSRQEDNSEPSAEPDPDEPYWEATQRWQTARSRGEIELVAKIRQLGMEGDWRALHVLAKMGWPDRYSDRVELTGAGGGPIQLEQLKSEALERAEQAIEEIKRKRQDAGTEGDDAPEISSGDSEWGDEIVGSGN